MIKETLRVAWSRSSWRYSMGSAEVYQLNNCVHFCGASTSDSSETPPARAYAARGLRSRVLGEWCEQI